MIKEILSFVLVYHLKYDFVLQKNQYQCPERILNKILLKKQKDLHRLQSMQACNRGPENWIQTRAQQML